MSLEEIHSDACCLQKDLLGAEKLEHETLGSVEAVSGSALGSRSFVPMLVGSGESWDQQPLRIVQSWGNKRHRHQDDWAMVE